MANVRLEFCWYLSANEFVAVSNPAFPRVPIIENLLHIVRQQPKLSKDASSALVDLGEAIQANASQEELSVLLRGTLMQEVYVRNSCLQTLQVSRRTTHSVIIFVIYCC